MTYNAFRVGKIWHYRFQLGKVRVQRTTRERNRHRAEVVAQQAYDDALIRINGGQVIGERIGLSRRENVAVALEQAL